MTMDNDVISPAFTTGRSLLVPDFLHEDLLEAVRQGADGVLQRAIDSLSGDLDLSLEKVAAVVVALYRVADESRWIIGDLLVWVESVHFVSFESHFSQWVSLLSDVVSNHFEEFPKSTLWSYYTTAKFNPRDSRLPGRSFTLHRDLTYLAGKEVDARYPALESEDRSTAKQERMQDLRRRAVVGDWTTTTVREKTRQVSGGKEARPGHMAHFDIADRGTGESTRVSLPDDPDVYEAQVAVLRRLRVFRGSPDEDGFDFRLSGNRLLSDDRTVLVFPPVTDSMFPAEAAMWLAGRVRAKIDDEGRQRW